MPIVTERKDQGRLYAHAVRNHYIIPAFHFFDLDSMKSILDAAEEERSPVVIQIGLFTHKTFSPLDKFLRYLKDYAADLKVPILLNHDHMQDLQDCFTAIDNGFPSVMFDGSHLPFDENAQKTREIAEYAHAQGAWVEAELGNIPGMEDTVFAEKTVYTDPQKAAEFIAASGCDSLAVAVGTAHGGVRAGGPLSIDYELLARIHEAAGDTPLVLHGAASLPAEYIDEVNRYGGQVEYLDMATEESIEKTRGYGVAKANMDVDNFLKYTAAVRRFFLESPDKYFPTQYLAYARQAMKQAVAHKMRHVTKSAGRGDTFQ